MSGYRRGSEPLEGLVQSFITFRFPHEVPAGNAMTHQGFCVWLTGLPSAGKTSIARALVPRLTSRGWKVELLDGDEVRRGLSADLGFDRSARESHAARVTFVAKVLARNGVIPIVALISPYATSRARARQEIGRLVVVYVTTPLYLF